MTIKDIDEELKRFPFALEPAANFDMPLALESEEESEEELKEESDDDDEKRIKIEKYKKKFAKIQQDYIKGKITTINEKWEREKELQSSKTIEEIGYIYP